MGKNLKLFSTEITEFLEDFLQTIRKAQSLNIQVDADDTIFYAGRMDERYNLVQLDQSIVVACLMAAEADQVFSLNTLRPIDWLMKRLQRPARERLFGVGMPHAFANGTLIGHFEINGNGIREFVIEKKIKVPDEVTLRMLHEIDEHIKEKDGNGRVKVLLSNGINETLWVSKDLEDEVESLRERMQAEEMVVCGEIETLISLLETQNEALCPTSIIVEKNNGIPEESTFITFQDPNTNKLSAREFIAESRGLSRETIVCAGNDPVTDMHLKDASLAIFVNDKQSFPEIDENLGKRNLVLPSPSWLGLVLIYLYEKAFAAKYTDKHPAFTRRNPLPSVDEMYLGIEGMLSTKRN